MGVDLQIYRQRIGGFNGYRTSGSAQSTEGTRASSISWRDVLGAVGFIGMLLLMAGIESNPGPGQYPDRGLTPKDIAKVSQYITLNWQLLAVEFDISTVEIQRIEMENSSVALRVNRMLNLWTDNKRDGANVSTLLTALEEYPSISVNWEEVAKVFGVDVLHQRQKRVHSTVSESDFNEYVVPANDYRYI
ncbi:uncharacterized protein LOC128228039 isoform X4 [Mya arenaria]|uniref:uncharacterized protein LOC128228039 isoform X4 n=1 Tax=Mya arenaria TaxID=6604 RepID=UPI0022E22AB8|nr:uncharacterized protein LOC128228039 isoform X4 [Mya arenaria]